MASTTLSKPSSQPRISIIGAGMGGLTCALALARRGFDQIHVYETASNLGFVGAGIQLAPNMARILDRLGVWSEIEAEAVVLNDTSIRDGTTDAELAHVELGYINEDYGYPHMVGHRHSLANGIYQGCLAQKGITFHFSTMVTNVRNFDSKPTFTAMPRSGSPETISTDVLLGCDGIKSETRAAMLDDLKIDPSAVKVVDTKQAAYRILLTREQMLTSPDLQKLIDSDRVTRWIAPKRHIIAYPVSNKTIYNISTVQPDTNFAAAPSATYTTKGSKTAMLEVFQDFCPVVQKMLNMVPSGEVCEWKLRVHSPLPTWIHGSVGLVGDACHPTLPHLAQGAAQAIEDAAVVAVCLSKLEEYTASTINTALRIYERIRKQRAETLVATAAASGKSLHLGNDNEHDSEAKKERDRMFANLQSGQGTGKVPDKWADRNVQKMIYGVDCEKIAEEHWDELWSAVAVAVTATATDGATTTTTTTATATAVSVDTTTTTT